MKKFYALIFAAIIALVVAPVLKAADVTQADPKASTVADKKADDKKPANKKHADKKPANKKHADKKPGDDKKPAPTDTNVAK